MNDKVREFVHKCKDCLAFTDKKTSEPLAAHGVPSKNWSKVAVDLFGPTPSSKHVVVVQDLASRFLAAKLVRSTKASNVIPAMATIYRVFFYDFRRLIIHIIEPSTEFSANFSGAFTTYMCLHVNQVPFPWHHFFFRKIKRSNDARIS